MDISAKWNEREWQHAMRQANNLHGSFCACTTCKPELEPEDRDLAIAKNARFNSPERLAKASKVKAMMERAKAV